MFFGGKRKKPSLVLGFFVLRQALAMGFFLTFAPWDSIMRARRKREVHDANNEIRYCNADGALDVSRGGAGGVALGI